MKISIIIPSFNSCLRVAEVIKRIKATSFGSHTKEIIVVDDCSLPETKAVLKKIKNIILIHHPTNTGKGGAVRTGLARATGNILIIQDDDLEYDPRQIPVLIRPLLARKADAVFGSRRLNKANSYSSPLYYFGGVFVDQLISFTLQTKLTDAITGAKAFTRNVYNKILPIKSNGFEIEAELSAKIVKSGARLIEIPISYLPRTHKEGKNIRWHHVFPMIKTIAYYAFLPVDN